MTEFLADMMPRFQAMSVGQILDSTLRMYVRHIPLLAGITAVAFVPYYGAAILLLLLARSGEPGLMTLVAVLVSGLGLVLLLFVLSPLSIAATLVAVSERYLERRVSIISAFRVALRRFIHVFLAYLLVGVVLAGIVLGGFLLISAVFLLSSLMGPSARFFFLLFFGTGSGVAMFGGMVAVFVIFSMVVPVVLLEKLNAVQAMRRSIELTRGNRIKIFAVFAVLYVVIIVVNVALLAAGMAIFGLEAVENPIFGQVTQMVGNLISTPLLYTSVVFVYYDLRIRKEAFDLDYLSQSLEEAVQGGGGTQPDKRG
ncbi:MAG TPA: hypothetical protein VLU25_19435 [Acidobacteriota bacterium]|nr:hypothetical protein [Acidobacteriota bacterium]